MDKGLYETMQGIFKEEKLNSTKNIEFLGSITYGKDTTTGNVDITKDIFMVIQENPDGTITKKFFDDDMNCVAGYDKNGRLFTTHDFMDESSDFLNQIANLSNNRGLSLEEFDNHLEKMAKQLGIDKKDILAMSEVELKQEVAVKQNKDEKSDLQITLNDEEQKNEEQIKANENALNNVSSKQEIKLDNKVDDRHSLGDILGVPAGSKLIAIYSNSIANNKNTTRFSFIIQNPDGTLEPADMLEQVGGKESNKSVYETNRDGSKVEKQSVNSSYAIKSDKVQNGILTARIGSMGYIELRLWSNG